jgi:hypothetical protein
VVGCLLGDQQLLDPLQLHTGISVSTEGSVLRNALAGADRPVAMSSVCACTVIRSICTLARFSASSIYA